MMLGQVATAAPIPILSRTEAIVVDGTLAGCVAAHALARAGRRTILCAARCSLPYEIVVCRRPWSRDEELAHLPEPFAAAFRESISSRTNNGECLLNLARLAIRVEDILLDAGVGLFYGMTPCGIVRGDNSSVCGVVFGGKFGLQAVAAASIVDCTATAVVAALAGAPVAARPHSDGRVTVGFSAKVGVATNQAPITEERGQRNTCPTEWPEESVLSVPGLGALAEGRILLHGPYAEFVFRLPVDTNDPLWYACLGNDLREQLVRVGARIAEARQARGGRPLFFHRFSGGLLMEPVVRIRAASPSEPYRPLGLDNAWVCGPAADVAEDEARRLAEPYQSSTVGQAVAEQVLKAPNVRHSLQQAVVVTAVGLGVAQPVGTLYFGDSHTLHGTGESVALADLALPVLAECEVLVAGGGTSGVPAALAAAQSGARTILIEQHDDVGGVRSIGGVASYWFGRETPYQRACDSAYDVWSARSGMAEEIAMRQCLLDAGVRVLTRCPAVGVVRAGSCVLGVVVAMDRGLGIVRANVIVDATGDADIAAWSGVPFDYGNGRDAWTMWCSFANFNEEKRTASRHYDSGIEVRDPYDFTRVIITGRRRQGMWRHLPHEMPQHYVAPRESRRIRARATVTYGGILAGETFPDVMIVCDSNFDIKGIAASDLLGCGVVWGWHAHKKFLAAIPYRAILPPNVENLLVAGRAYGASHDALALARMQRDMVSLGAAAGMAAAMAATTGTLPSQLDITTLQDEWVRRGVLRARDRRRFGAEPKEYSATEAEHDAQAVLTSRVRLPERLARLMRCKASLDPLRRAFESARERSVKVRLARALCYLGDATPVPFLLDTITAQVAKGLPRPYRRTLAIPPEHGWAPEPAYSLYAIGMTSRGRDAAPLMTAIAAKIADDPDLFASPRDSPFEYVRAICTVAERNAGPEMLPALETLLRKNCLRGLAIRYDGDMRGAGDPVHERRAYLELCLGRALARCADRRGYDILLAYADDVRGCLARSAVTELYDLLGAPYGDNKCGWKALLDQRDAALPLKPFRGAIG